MKTATFQLGFELLKKKKKRKLRAELKRFINTVKNQSCFLTAGFPRCMEEGGERGHRQG